MLNAGVPVIPYQFYTEKIKHPINKTLFKIFHYFCSEEHQNRQYITL